MRSVTSCILAAATIVLASPGPEALGGLVPIGSSNFPAGSSLITFENVTSGTNPNGLSLAGATFGMTAGGSAYNSATIDGNGPGMTNNVGGQFIDVTPAPAGLVLTVTFSSSETLFGFGYAVLASGTVPDATTIQLFNGSTSLGSLSYTASPDPNFPGGFAGVQSSVAFTSAQMTFTSAASAFVVDNVTFGPSAVPEPSSLALTGPVVVGGLCLALARRRRGSKAGGG